MIYGYIFLTPEMNAPLQSGRPMIFRAQGSQNLSLSFGHKGHQNYKGQIEVLMEIELWLVRLHPLSDWSILYVGFRFKLHLRYTSPSPSPSLSLSNVSSTPEPSNMKVLSFLPQIFRSTRPNVLNLMHKPTPKIHSLVGPTRLNLFFSFESFWLKLSEKSND